MGADLYIDSIYNKRQDQYQDSFHAAAAKRDNAQTNEEKERAQKEVEILHELMFREGYFRDSYNVTSVLQTLGLSWWQHVIPMLNKKGYLSVKKTRDFLKIIEVAKQTFPNEDELKKQGAMIQEEGDNSLERWHKGYRNARDELIKFLKTAIELNEAISCSL